MKGRDFIFTGLQPWELPIGSNARDMAMEVARSNRVLYVNTPLVKWSRELVSERPDLQRRIEVLRGNADPFRRLGENLWVLDMPFTVFPVNKLPDGPLFDAVNRVNNRMIFKYVRRKAEELGFSDTIHIIDNDIYRGFYSKQYLRPAVSVYYRRDNLLAIDYWKRHALRLEPLLMGRSDLVVCNSAYLARTARGSNPLSFDIGQGVDLAPFAAYDSSLPSDMEGIPRPVVGYMGHITSLRLDAGLIYDLARRNHSRSFVLAGSADDVFMGHQMRALPNLFFLGPKRPCDVPRYINSFDVCINPQAVNDLTIGNYPRKIDEYLALGKPVIATATEAMEMFGEYVRLCGSADEYQQALDDILAGDTGHSCRERVEFAHTHTWAASVGGLYDAIGKTETL